MDTECAQRQVRLIASTAAMCERLGVQIPKDAADITRLRQALQSRQP